MTTTTLRRELPSLPDRMKRLKIDDRGYPVPWFVAWLDENKEETTPGEGHPDFRVLRSTAIREALRFRQCWICGGQLGRYQAFVIGPMCMVNRINSEPPSHLDCADYAGRACPFLSRPHMRRRENNLPEAKEMPGSPIMRNPGVTCVWVTDKGFPIKRVSNGILFELPEPTETRFYCEGRPATREEVHDTIEEGLSLLLDACETDSERGDVYTLVKGTQRFWPT